MKFSILAIIASVVIAFLGGCATGASNRKGLLVQPLLDRIVPADFTGDGEFAERGQYVILEVKARGLKKTGDAWSWQSLDYRRTLNIPLTTGIPYRQEAWIHLGPPAAAPATVAAP